MAPQVLQETPSKVVDVAKVVHHGENIILPETMTKESAIEVIHRAIQYENELVQVAETIDAFPWDGAVAFKQALDEKFGVVFAQKGIFGTPPQEIAVETDAVGGKVLVAWGKFSFPGGKREEFLSVGTDMKDGRIVFNIHACVVRKNKPIVEWLAERTKTILALKSIYRGKALRMKFRDEDGDPIILPTPKFLDLSKTDASNLIFRAELMRAIQTNIWTPLRHRRATQQAGVPFKRGILLAGPYGTGKTLAAHATAVEAIKAGVTFLYLEDVRELPEAIRFVRRYSPAVVFAEDIDRATSGEERTIELDTVLNTLDGVDSKDAEVMVVLTTNHLEKINRAMLRPGRLDVVLNVLPPDAEAVRRLIIQYGNKHLAKGISLDKVGAMLDGHIPAVVREVVERSKLEAISRSGKAFEPIGSEDLEQAAYTVLQQIELFKDKPAEKATTLDAAMHTMLEQAVSKVDDRIDYRLGERFGR